MNHCKKNRVSVCIATHNGEKYIRDLLDNILIQLEIDDEIVISDDGSSDRTLEIIEKKYNDSRIRIFKISPFKKGGNLSYEEKLKNIFFNFRNAVLNATGDYVFLCDQDDIWHKDKVRIVRYELQNKDLVIHNAIIMSTMKNVDGNKFIDTSPPINFYNILRYNPFLGCCIAARTDLVRFAFSWGNIPIPHDTWLILVTFIFSFDMKFVDIPLLKYRVEAQNNSYVFHSNNSLYFKVKYRFLLVFNILLLWINYKLGCKHLK